MRGGGGGRISGGFLVSSQNLKGAKILHKFRRWCLDFSVGCQGGSKIIRGMSRGLFIIPRGHPNFKNLKNNPPPD